VTATLIGQVALRAAVVQPHPLRIADAGGGDRVADQHDLAASLEERPDRLVSGDRARGPEREED